MAKRAEDSLELDRGEAWQVAVAAHVNARSLQSAAVSLISTGHHGAAAAIAVLALEEAAKSLHAYAFAVSGEANRGMWDVLFSKHKPKQASALMQHSFASIEPRLDRFATKRRERFDRRNPNVSDQERIDRLSLWLLRFLERFARRHKSAIAGAGACARDARRTAFEERELDELKMRGFYVGFDRGERRVTDPRHLTAADASRPLQVLADGLRNLDMIGDLAGSLRQPSNSELELAEQQVRTWFFGLLGKAGLWPTP